MINHNTRLMAQMLAMGLACNQTRVFTMLHSPATNGLFLPGDPSV